MGAHLALAGLSWHHPPMTTPARLQYTSIRTRSEDGRELIGLKHTASGDRGEVKTEWIEMPPEDVRRLIKALQDALAKLGA